MAELVMLAEIQRTVYPEEVSRQLHDMAQGRKSLPVIDRRSNQLCYTAPNEKVENDTLMKNAAVWKNRQGHTNYTQCV